MAWSPCKLQHYVRHGMRWQNCVGIMWSPMASKIVRLKNSRGTRRPSSSFFSSPSALDELSTHPTPPLSGPRPSFPHHLTFSPAFPPAHPSLTCSVPTPPHSSASLAVSFRAGSPQGFAQIFVALSTLSAIVPSVKQSDYFLLSSDERPKA